MCENCGDAGVGKTVVLGKKGCCQTGKNVTGAAFCKGWVFAAADKTFVLCGNKSSGTFYYDCGARKKLVYKTPSLDACFF